MAAKGRAIGCLFVGVMVFDKLLCRWFGVGV